jgi:uncharacterized protein YhhL (DUF1145 family)
MLKAMINFRNYRWTARISGFIGMALIVSFLAGEGMEMIKNSNASKDMLFLLILFSLSFLAYITGWLVEIAGGLMLILSGIVMVIYLGTTVIFSSLEHQLILTLPFFITGIFFLLSWRHKILRMKPPS